LTKPPVRLLVPVWGERYIKLFADLTLMSLLAPGNLPALAEATELEVVMLTASSDHRFFDAEPAFAALRRIAPVRFESIDDLIGGGLYGVTLTLAYLRGVAALGEKMVDTHFVFLNADLILADGSLRSVARRILAGDRVLLACSIRATSEDLEPRLRALVDAERGVLAVPPRILVGMAMAAMHPTQIAKIVNSDLCHSIHVNQFYWQVDAHTLVSRHFLMFMLCLRPERVVTEVHAFCDYSFVPEMCPESPTKAMEDSDEFFFLEMQARDSERDFLRLGRATTGEIAESLSRWTTKGHRAYSLDHTLIFRAGDPPPGTPAVCEEADRYIRAIHRELAPQPQPFRHHPYWTGTYDLWLARRKPSGAAGPGTESGSASALPLRIARGVYRSLFGRPPEVSVLHPDWIEYRAVNRVLRARAGAPRERVLYVSGGAGLLAGCLGAASAVSLDEALNGSPSPALTGTQRYALVLVELGKGRLRQVRTAIERLRPLTAAGGEIAVFVKAAPGEAADVGDQLLEQLGLVAPQEMNRLTVTFAGGTLRGVVRGFIARGQRLHARYGWKSAPAVGALIAAASVLSLLANWRQASIQDARAPVASCSAVTFVFHN
jgi:hypothetical protein